MLILLMAACALPAAWLPSAEPAGLHIRTVSFDTVEAALRVDVHNPLPFALPVRSLDGTLAIAGHHVLDTRAEPSPLAARSTTRVELPIRLDWSDALAVTDAERLDWTLDVALVLALPGGDRTLNLQPTGTLPSLRPPTLGLLGVDIVDADLFRGELAVLVRLGARGAVGVQILRGHLVLSLGDAPVAEAAALPGPAGGLLLPVRLHAGAAATELARAAVARTLPRLQVTGALELRTPFGDMPLHVDRRWPLTH